MARQRAPFSQQLLRMQKIHALLAFFHAPSSDAM
jgi:hypothetical protein